MAVEFQPAVAGRLSGRSRRVSSGSGRQRLAIGREEGRVTAPGVIVEGHAGSPLAGSQRITVLSDSKSPASCRPVNRRRGGPRPYELAAFSTRHRSASSRGSSCHPRWRRPRLAIGGERGSAHDLAVAFEPAQLDRLILLGHRESERREVLDERTVIMTSLVNRAILRPGHFPILRAGGDGRKAHAEADWDCPHARTGEKTSSEALRTIGVTAAFLSSRNSRRQAE